MTVLTSRKPDPIVAVRRMLPEDCTAGLYVGAVDRLIAAAERMEVEE